MTKVIVVLALATSVPLVFVASQEQQREREFIDRTLQSYLASVGGQAAIKQISSLAAEGTIEVFQKGLSGKFEERRKSPNKSLTRVELKGVGILTEAFDGTDGWITDLQGQTRVLELAECTERKWMERFPFELTLAADPAPILAKGASSSVGNAEAVVLVTSPVPGETVRLFFDSLSGRLLRKQYRRRTVEGPYDIQTTFDDFRRVGVVTLPFKQTHTIAGFTATVTFSKILLNEPTDDQVFHHPLTKNRVTGPCRT